MHGSYEQRAFDEDGKPEPQRVWAKCDVCGAEWTYVCDSGMVRERINTFAQVHLHRDPLKNHIPGMPGMPQ